jgi:aspartate aminotransferase-like enzyme
MTMPTLPPFGRFFLPGPTEVRPEILQAMIGPMLGHRSRAMEEVMEQCQPGLRALFRTNRPVYVSTSSATGLMEAAVRNCARRRVLSLVNGAFSERFYRIAAACGVEVDALEVPWGDAHTPEMLHDALRRKEYDAVTVVHSETSTGVLNPVRDLLEVAHAAGDVALLVDAVSSLGGAPIETDAWGIDFVLTGSQKCLALPPGLALGVAQEPMLARSEMNPNRGIYFDFHEFERNLNRSQTPNTPAVSLFYALAAQCARIEAEGVEARWLRHEAMARRTWAWVADMRDRGLDVEILADARFRSPTVTTFLCPGGWTGPRLAAALAERGFVIATGYGRMNEQTFRIGHMGDHTVAELDHLLGTLEEVLLA